MLTSSNNLQTFNTPLEVLSSSGVVGVATTQIIEFGTYQFSLTIQNTHATQMLYISGNAIMSTSDFVIKPLDSFTFPFATNSAIFAKGSAAGTTYAIIGA